MFLQTVCCFLSALVFLMSVLSRQKWMFQLTNIHIFLHKQVLQKHFSVGASIAHVAHILGMHWMVSSPFCWLLQQFKCCSFMQNNTIIWCSLCASFPLTHGLRFQAQKLVCVDLPAYGQSFPSRISSWGLSVYHCWPYGTIGTTWGRGAIRKRNALCEIPLMCSSCKWDMAPLST